MSVCFWRAFSVGLLLVAFGSIGWWLVIESGVWSRDVATREAVTSTESSTRSFTEEEAGFDDEPPAAPEYRVGRGLTYTLSELAEWERPEGPSRVGIQVGHLDNDQVPEELAGLRRNGGGAQWGNLTERETMAPIAEAAAARLRAAGVAVDILPATVPPGYLADAFISLHADGNPNVGVRGFKIAGPRRDYAGTSEALVAALTEQYRNAGLPEDPNISRRMTAYYAFNWPRYEHAIHPKTPAAIVETGFLTNATDRAFIINEAEQAGGLVAAGVLDFLSSDPAPLPPPTPNVSPTLPLSGTLTCATVRPERRNREPSGSCTPAITITDGYEVLLVEVSATNTPEFVLGETATVFGTYVPVQTLDNYFWFRYDAIGLLTAVQWLRTD